MKNPKKSLSTSFADGFFKGSHPFKYWEILLSFLFRYSSRCYELSNEQKPYIMENCCDALYRLGQSYRTKQHPRNLICQVTEDPEDISHANYVLKQVYNNLKNPHLCELATAELLAKVVAYRQLKEGDKIAIPSLQPNGEMALARYRVDRVFDLWSQMLAFGLVSTARSFASPILLFRGTNFSFRKKEGRASIISDLDPKGPGWSVFLQASPVLCKWLSSQEKKQARLIGHSLGGSMAAYTLIKNPSLISNCPLATSYMFNFPGVSAELMDEWKKMEKRKQPACKIIVSRGDLVSKLGNLFGEVFEASVPRPLHPISAHELLLFAEPLCYLHQVDISRENLSSSRQLYSKMQKQTSSLIYEIGLKFLFPS